jgi:Putative Ig domain
MNMKTLIPLLLITSAAWAQPGTPTNVVAYPMADTMCGIMWDRADNTETSVLVGRSTTSGGTYTYRTLRGYHTNVAVDKSLYPSTTYWYKVQVSNGSGTTTSAVVNTSSSASISSGSQTVTPASITGITTGVPLVIDDGTINREVVVPTVSGSTFTATFVNSHTTTPVPISIGSCSTFTSGAYSYQPLASFSVTNVDSWTNTLSWSDPNSAGLAAQIQRSFDGVWFDTIATFRDANGINTVNDPATGNCDPSPFDGSGCAILQPGQTVYYRVRLFSDSSSSGTPITTYYSNFTPTQSVTTAARPGGGALEPTQPVVYTTSTSSISTGSQTVTVTGGNAMTNIATGAWLLVGAIGNAETVQVTGTTGTTFTATFALSHTATSIAPIPIANANFVENTSTQTSIYWRDTNSGAKVYCVYTSPYNNAAGNNPAPVWTLAGTTSAGATSFALTTVAETFYYVRVNADCAGTPSGYTNIMRIRSPSPTVGGGGNVYNVTAGTGTYPTIQSTPIATGLGPGDTVNIGAGTYYEKFLLSNRGTLAQPITISCAAGAIIDGTNALQQAASQFADEADWSDNNLVMISRRTSMNSSAIAWAPGYYIINGCTFQNANPSLTYTQVGVGTRNYASPACLYMFQGDHNLIENNTITGCYDGYYSGGGGNAEGDQREVRFNTYSGNNMYLNGLASNALYHDMYIEEQYPIVSGNNFGTLVTGSYGIQLKDRSCGPIIEYNTMSSTASSGNAFNLGGTQNYMMKNFACPDYDEVSVLGNIMNYSSTSGNVSSTDDFVYIADPLTITSRPGPIRFYNNTLSVIGYSGGVGAYWYGHQGLTWGTFDDRNNIENSNQNTKATAIYLIFSDSTSSSPGAPNYASFGYSGSNWLSQARYCNIFNTCKGWIGNKAGIITSGSINFNAPLSGDFHITSGSAAAGIGGVLPSNWPPVNLQQSGTVSVTPRVNGTNDAGAYGLSGSPVAPTITSTTPLPGGTQGVAYSYQFLATGTPTVTWSSTAGSLPSGIAGITSGGLITGTPTASGTFTYTVQAANGVGNSLNGPIAYSLTIAANVAPTITTSCGAFVGGTQGVTYPSVTLAATGTPASFTWALSSGSLPNGLSLIAGVVSGTPTSSGTSNFSVTATNTAGTSTPLSCSIAVAAASASQPANANR